MAISSELRRMARDAILGMTQDEAIGATGLSRSTFQALITGNVVGEDKYRKFALGLGVDPGPFIALRREFRPPADPFAELAYLLRSELGLAPATCREIIALVRRRQEGQHEATQNKEEKRC